MIKETQRVVHQEESGRNLEDAKQETLNQEAADGLRKEPVNQSPDRSVSRTSFLYIELLVCSLLLWSLLFLKDSSYGKTIIDSLSNILSQKIDIEPFESIISQLSEAARQIL